MPSLKLLSVRLQRLAAGCFALMSAVVLKSFWAIPLFFAVHWLDAHHAPSPDMWYGFFMGAMFFTSASKKIGSRPSKEHLQQPISPIIQI